MNWSGRWLVVIVASTAAAIAAADVASGTAFTTLPLLWFLAVCPGMPYARLIAPVPDRDPVRRWLTAIGLSVAGGAVVAEVLLYADAFTGGRTVAVLGGVAILGAVIDVLVERAREEPSPAATE
jgi:hypothetical protein